MLAGNESVDPKDKSSGVKITVEPSVALLEDVDGFAQEAKTTREAALLVYAALGLLSKKAVKGFFGMVSGLAAERDTSSQSDPHALEVALIRKRAFEDAAQVCDKRAASYRGTESRLVDLGHEIATAEACAAEIRAASKKECDEVANRFDGRQT